jgi:hypothetical protein
VFSIIRKGNITTFPVIETEEEKKSLIFQDHATPKQHWSFSLQLHNFGKMCQAEIQLAEEKVAEKSWPNDQSSFEIRPIEVPP